MRKLMFITLLMAVSLSVQAQQPNSQSSKPAPKGAQERRENVTEFKMKQIEEILKLEGRKLESFREIYTEYSEARKAIRPRLSFKRDIALSDKEIEAKIMESFAEMHRAIEMQEEYYARFKKILSPREIAAVYEVDRRVRERAMSEMKRRRERARPE